MAAALFQNGLTDSEKTSIEVKSCGLAAFSGDTATENAIETMRLYGINIENHRSTPLNPYDLTDTDLFVCMTESHKAALLRLNVEAERIIVLNIPDPFGGDLETYRKCAEKTETELIRVYDAIRE